jgi:cytochrome c oxidase assembly factor CtaG/cytochrome c2
VRDRRLYALVAGAAVALLALVGLHGAADRSLAGHMAQHVLLLNVAGPLLALGTAVPRVLRGARPAVALAAGVVVQTTAVWVWHAPGPYQAAIRTDALHAAEHLVFLGAAMVFWWSVMSAARRGGYGLAVVAVFVAAVPATMLGVGMTFARTPWYPAAAIVRPTLTSALHDQQLAGVVMWAFGGLASVVAGVAVFAAWVSSLEQATARRARRDAVAGLAVTLTLAALVLTACSSGPARTNVRLGPGDAAVGKRAIQHYGCGSCHTIPGVRGARALVGPPLEHFSRRSYIAGHAANTPENLARWIGNPQSIEPGTVMPNLGVSEDEARNIAAYLESLA